MPKFWNLRKVSTAVFYIVLVLWTVFIGWQVRRKITGTVQVRVANLMVALHESAELPVYSKFYITQTVAFSRATAISVIKIPIRQPANSESSLRVSVQGDEEQTFSGNFSVLPSMAELTVPINFIRPVNKITVMLSASDVSWKVKDAVAPRVYRESSRAGYRDGEMTIAGIKKDGNIGLSVFADYSKISYMKKQFDESPKIIASWFREVLLVFLVLIFPAVFFEYLFAQKQK